MPIAETFGAIAVRPVAQARWRLRLLGIGAAEAEFARRGFRLTTRARRQHLERVGQVFIAGYNAAIATGDPATIGSDLEAPPPEFQAFACEGAAMGFALLDLITPWRARRFARFVAGPASRHVYMAYVGAGWALARTSLRLAWRLGPLDPLLRWLVIDGYGFHAGYFHHRDAVEGQRRPLVVRGYAAQVFDQGLGRAIWFVKGADVGVIASTLGTFRQKRQADLWSGIGLAAAYAGGVGTEDLTALYSAAGPYRSELGQGATFAAKARERAGNMAKHTERACRIFCGVEAAEAAAITDRALGGLDLSDPATACAAWRAKIRNRLEVKPEKVPRR